METPSDSWSNTKFSLSFTIWYKVIRRRINLLIRSNVGLYLFYKGIHLSEKQVSEVISRAIIDLAPVVQKVDNAIHQLNHYPLESAIAFPNTYLLDSDLSTG